MTSRRRVRLRRAGYVTLSLLAIVVALVCHLALITPSRPDIDEGLRYLATLDAATEAGCPSSTSVTTAETTRSAIRNYLDDFNWKLDELVFSDGRLLLKASGPDRRHLLIFSVGTSAALSISVVCGK